MKVAAVPLWSIKSDNFLERKSLRVKIEEHSEVATYVFVLFIIMHFSDYLPSWLPHNPFSDALKKAGDIFDEVRYRT